MRLVRWSRGLMETDQEVEEEVLCLLDVRPLSYKLLRIHAFHQVRLRVVLRSLEERGLIRCLRKPGDGSFGHVIVLRKPGLRRVSELLNQR